MEAMGCVDTRPGLGSRGLFVASHHARGRRLAEDPGGPGLVDPRTDHRAPSQGLGASLAEVRRYAETAVNDVGRLGFQEVVALASDVEELSRAVEYLQLVMASGLDRVRGEEAGKQAAPAGWRTGWSAAPGTASSQRGTGGDRGAEFRSTAEHLRSLLRISTAEAKRRLALAEELLPGRGLTGQTVPPRHEETAAALASGAIGSRSAGIITMALEKVRPLCGPEKALEIEYALARTAEQNDQDFLARVARRWVDAVDQDGPEPSEESLRCHQGAFLRRPKHGLQHVEIFATTEQYEHLLTVMNTATNPRTSASRGTLSACGEPSGVEPSGGAPEAGVRLDPRSRPQKLLDGLVGACKLALADGSLPATGGHRPQIMATIDHRELFTQYTSHTQSGQSAQSGESPRSGELPRSGASGLVLGTGSFTFTGPVSAATLRKLACDADIIPVVLGGEGQVLDIGRASRTFPPHIRKAITARDKGCAFPGCTMPAPWCEAHHIEYWSRGGPTSAGNGTLLCSHHHHLIHKEDWHIQVSDGIPWFIPPPHIDPHPRPRRYQYFQL